jgi:hypothetical protein
MTAPNCPICKRGPMDDHPNFGLSRAFRYSGEPPCDFEVGMGPIKESVKRWHKEHPPGWERARILVIRLEPDEADDVRKAAGSEEDMRAWAHEAIVTKAGIRP